LTSQLREQLRAGTFVILAFGVVLTLVSIFADPLALGLPGSGFGWKQTTGTIVGLIIFALGLWLTIRLGNDELDQP
jgi:thiol:disulfide interchange protein